MERGRPANVCVAPGGDFLDVFLCVEFEEGKGCSAGRVRAFHAEGCQCVERGQLLHGVRGKVGRAFDSAIGEVLCGPVQICAEV